MKLINRINDLKSNLAKFYTKVGDERCGFIKASQTETTIIEVKNIAGSPEKGFEISGEDILKYTETEPCWATWHTHPGQDANLSGEDYKMFKYWPALHHFIVGDGQVKCYYFDKDKKAILETGV